MKKINATKVRNAYTTHVRATNTWTTVWGRHSEGPIFHSDDVPPELLEAARDWRVRGTLVRRSTGETVKFRAWDHGDGLTLDLYPKLGDTLTFTWSR